MSRDKINVGMQPADPRYHITVTDDGPYLVYGRPPLAVQRIVVNRTGESWYFEAGDSFSTNEEPTALCRCGASRNKPYCDGSHSAERWQPRLTARAEAMLDNVELSVGDRITITDNSQYCAFARFCDASGGTWANAEASYDEHAARMAVRTASLCPSGRLTAWDNDTEQPYELHYEPSLGLIEDPAVGASGGLWVRGGIVVRRADGRAYEIRNRMIMCRCGHSANKPYCDGSHAALRWRDELQRTVDATTADQREELKIR